MYISRRDVEDAVPYAAGRTNLRAVEDAGPYALPSPKRYALGARR